MKIYADKNILSVRDSFQQHGELHLFDGRSVSAAELRSADALLVRSITDVDASLLQGTNIQFVGSATSGIDHIDATFLNQAGIRFADAKGSNANAVVDYCFTALALAILQNGGTLLNRSVGIVGAGAVGSLFADKLEKFGVRALCCDPILAESGDATRKYFSMAEVLACDVVSLHVPLTRGGPAATYNLIGREELNQLRADAIFINACRGHVVNESALLDFLTARGEIFTVFDVWAREPDIDKEVVAKVSIATPHIAGYSVEAKSNATDMLLGAFEDHFQLERKESEAVKAVAPELISILDGSGETREWQTLVSLLPLGRLSERFKRSTGNDSGALEFDSIRAELLGRHEFTGRMLKEENYSCDQRRFLSVLGFAFV